MLYIGEKFQVLPGTEAQFLSHPACNPVMTLSNGHEHIEIIPKSIKNLWCFQNCLDLTATTNARHKKNQTNNPK